jgi:bifunctional DNA-binding transcriptional regulator/antitoxin component of YhaV-PrlF toxin-antitoxin module
MVKIVNNKGQYKITIPKDIMLSKGWDENTQLRYVEDLDGNIVLKELPTQKVKKKKKNAKK